MCLHKTDINQIFYFFSLVYPYAIILWYLYYQKGIENITEQIQIYCIILLFPVSDLSQ